MPLPVQAFRSAGWFHRLRGSRAVAESEPRRVGV